jgi:hypothetical protein
MFQKNEFVSSGRNFDDVMNAYEICAEKFQVDKLKRAKQM